jgi:hypothetical protein
MSPRKHPDPKKERFWRRTLRDWQRSGLTIRAFCQQHDLSEPSFYFWRRTLAERQVPTPTFVPLQLLADDPPPAVNAAAAGGLELLLRGGHVLRIGPGFDGSTLRRLLEVLEEHRL